MRVISIQTPIRDTMQFREQNAACATHLRRVFVDALPKDAHTPEASKPAQAILRLNRLFDIEAELEGLSPDQKKKGRLIREKPLLEAFWSWAEKKITARDSSITWKTGTVRSEIHWQRLAVIFYTLFYLTLTFFLLL